MKRALFTICAENFLSSAKILMSSISDNSSTDLDLFVIVSDKLSCGIPNGIKATVIEFDDFYGENFFHQKIRYNITEYCTFLKPYSFSKLFEEYDQVVYLDPDIQFYNDVSLIYKLFQEQKAEILITPHFLKCTIEDKPYSEINHLFEGIYNFGFVGFYKSAATSRLLEWWKKRLYDYCYGDRTTNLHTDQKWGDYFPALFPDITKIVAHEGMNVAHWNLHERVIQQKHDDFIVNSEVPLVFFHFSGFDYFGDGLVRRGGVEVETSQNIVGALADKYRESLGVAGFNQQINLPYDWNYDADGNIISHFQRRILRNMAYSEFNDVNDYYKFWKKNGLVDEKVLSYAGYSKNTEKNLDKKLHIVHMGLRLIKHLLGMSRYARLVKLFEYLSRIENHLETFK